MANPSVTNVDGTNFGPNSSTLPDTVQMPVGNVWKLAVVTWTPSSVTLTPASVAASTSAEQSYAATGIGLVVGDFVQVSAPAAALNNGAIGSARVSSTDTLAITYVNPTAAGITPTSTGVYTIFIARPQPNWTAPAVAPQIDW